jgi:hypothetical protein
MDSTIQPRPKLADILRDNDSVDNLREMFDETEAADEFRPLPRGVYECHVRAGELTTSQSGTPGYSVRFVVIDGEHKGRFVWHTLWLTSAALAMTKRDLAKLGIKSLDQLEKPLPEDRIRCRVHVVMHHDDDGSARNNVRKFEVTGVDEPQPDAFAPSDAGAPAGDAGRSSQGPFGSGEAL